MAVGSVESRALYNRSGSEGGQLTRKRHKTSRFLRCQRRGRLEKGQRIAGRGLGQHLSDIGRELGQEGSDVAEPVQSHHGKPARRKLRFESALCPDREKHGNRFGDQASGREAESVGGRRIEPLQVIDDKQEPFLVAEDPQSASTQGQASGGVATPHSECRSQRCGLRFRQCGQGADIQQRRECGMQTGVREVSLRLHTAEPDDREPFGLRLHSCGFQEGRLAYPRRTGHDQGAAVPLSSCLEQRPYAG